MVGKYEVVTLCGSTKFKDDFIKAQEFLTLTGCIVISVGLFGHADNKYKSKISPDVKAMLDDMHKRKIDMADSILVINRDDYIGESTRSEIEYAASIGKKITYMFNHRRTGGYIDESPCLVSQNVDEGFYMTNSEIEQMSKLTGTIAENCT